MTSITDLAITWQSNGWNNRPAHEWARIWVSRLSDGSDVAGAKINIFDVSDRLVGYTSGRPVLSSAQIRHTTTTDIDGTAVIDTSVLSSLSNHRLAIYVSTDKNEKNE